MILLAGGTGRLGADAVRLLRQRGLEVRVLTRDRGRAAHLAGYGVEIVQGDVRDHAAVRRAAEGIDTIVSAIQGFAGTKEGSPATIDRDGNRNLILAARDATVKKLVLVSVRDASADHPMDLMRMKYAAEEQLKGSGLDWTIIRPTAFMETWCDVLGRPLIEKGKTQVFGPGRNPINWVSTADVAGFVELAVVDPGTRGEVIEVGGPENLTMTEFVQVFGRESGVVGRVGHIPVPAMRVMTVAMRLVNPGLARLIQAGLLLETRPQAFDALPIRARYPSIPLTSLAQAIKMRRWTAALSQ